MAVLEQNVSMGENTMSLPLESGDMKEGLNLVINFEPVEMTGDEASLLRRSNRRPMLRCVVKTTNDTEKQKAARAHKRIKAGPLKVPMIPVVTNNRKNKRQRQNSKVTSLKAGEGEDQEMNVSPPRGSTPEQGPEQGQHHQEILIEMPIGMHMAEDEKTEAWTVDDSKALYRVDGWGEPYFNLNEKGNLVVTPWGEEGSPAIDVFELVQNLTRQNVSLPITLRFPEIMCHRLKTIQDAFASAIQTVGFTKHYQGVFPVKCNHDRRLLETVVNYGKPTHFGLEAGSKPELLLAASLLQQAGSDGLLICNGYKDEAYIETVLLTSQLNNACIMLVLEKLEELPLILEVSKRMGISPRLGIRAKLSTKHGGHWGSTSGDSAKFGLGVRDIWRAVEMLRAADKLDCLQLLHYHIGSQIAQIRTIKEAMREASHVYAELCLLGARMGYMDVGGGLGIDYDGTKGGDNSINYSIQHYANDVVSAVHDACMQKRVPEPILVTESGRALASHHAILIFDVRSVSQQKDEPAYIAKKPSPTAAATDVVPAATSVTHGTYLLNTFHEVLYTMNSENYQEAFNDAMQFRAEARTLFRLGVLSIGEVVQAEDLYHTVIAKALRQAPANDLPEDFLMAAKASTAIYHVNMSIFRSAPDTWAIGQVFPIMPLHRLDEEPTVRATLADLTCDSDGHLTDFVLTDKTAPADKTSKTLLLHEIPVSSESMRVGGAEELDTYVMGMFLGGAYQETMGSAHNLFGVTNVVNIRTKNCPFGPAPRTRGSVKELPYILSTGNPEAYVESFHVGQNVAQVLLHGDHVASEMVATLTSNVHDALLDGLMTQPQADCLLKNVTDTMKSSTYLSLKKKTAC